MVSRPKDGMGGGIVFVISRTEDGAAGCMTLWTIAVFLVVRGA